MSGKDKNSNNTRFEEVSSVSLQKLNKKRESMADFESGERH